MLIAGGLDNIRYDLLSDAAKGPTLWAALARKMGPQALRMNLNTLLRRDVFHVAASLRDADASPGDADADASLRDADASLRDADADSSLGETGLRGSMAALFAVAILRRNPESVAFAAVTEAVSQKANRNY